MRVKRRPVPGSKKKKKRVRECGQVVHGISLDVVGLVVWSVVQVSGPLMKHPCSGYRFRQKTW